MLCLFTSRKQVAGLEQSTRGGFFPPLVFTRSVERRQVLLNCWVSGYETHV